MPKPGQPNDSASWLLSGQECRVPSQNFAISQGVFGTSSDIYLLVVPIQSIFQLMLPMKRKLRVGAVFMLGIMYVHIPSFHQTFPLISTDY